MDLYQLDCFRTVARMEHISNAAVVLHVTQPSLSKIISRVESYAGVPLFDRNKGKIRLNASGTAFLKTLDQVFELIEQGKKEAVNIRDRANNHIRLAACCDSILFMLAETFFSEHPDVRVRYMVMTPEQIREGFLHNNLDFALTTYPLHEKEVEWESAADEEILMVVGPSSPFYDRKSIAVSELDGVEIMCENAGELRARVCACCETAGFSPNIVMESNEGAVMGFNVGLVRAVSFVPAHRFMQIEEGMRRGIGHGLPLHAVRLEMPRCHWVTGLARRPEKMMNPICEEFYHMTLDYFQNLREKMAAFMRDYFGVEE